ncbi:MAG: dual specificity protein phosphatase family protein [bacterium]
MLLNSHYSYNPQIYLKPSFRGVSSSIKNFQKVDDCLYRGGNPTLEQLRQLKKQGFSTIVSFRTGYQGNEFDEAQAVKALGMKHIHLPFISWDNPPENHVSTFFANIEQAKSKGEKVFIHCTHGKDRTGLFSAMYKLTYGLDNIDDCIREMFKLGHNATENPNLIPYLRNFAQKLPQRRI